MKPAELSIGDRIVHRVPKMNGTLTVYREPWDDIDHEVRPGAPDLSRVFVDVEVSDRSTRWDPVDLPAGIGAV